MNEIKNFATLEDNNLQTQETNRFAICEDVVDTLVEQGLPSSFNPDNFISRIANAYNLTTQEARTCLKLAIKQIELSEVKENSDKKEEKLYAQSGYFYPNSSLPVKNHKSDGMDRLSSLGSYNQLMFGLKH